jgi:hypothetical protein
VQVVIILLNQFFSTQYSFAYGGGDVQKAGQRGLVYTQFSYTQNDSKLRVLTIRAYLPFAQTSFKVIEILTKLFEIGYQFGSQRIERKVSNKFKIVDILLAKD